MKQATSRKKNRWFWIGVALLSISALFWLTLIFVIAVDPEDTGGRVLTTVVITVVPIMIGIYCVRRGKRVPATIELKLGYAPAYRTQPTPEPAQRRRVGFFYAPKEKKRITFGQGKSVGLVEIQHSSIRWVNCLRQSDQSGNLYTKVYLVPDPRVFGERRLQLNSVRVRNRPIFGPVVDLHWEAYLANTKTIRWLVTDLLIDLQQINLQSDLIMRLDGDVWLRQSLIKLNKDVTIRIYPEHGCWAIWSSIWSRSQTTPSRDEQWDCFETIARHLLESSGK